jgi:NitT/TauT family transport system substrate-binding protein
VRWVADAHGERGTAAAGIVAGVPRRRASIVLALALIVAAGCSGPAVTSPGGAGDGPETPEITVGTLPIVDVAPIHVAIEEGLFAAEGLSVSVEVTQGGAAAIPALIGGDLDIAYGAWPSFLIANQEGLALRAVADGTAARPGFTQLLALPGSGLEGNPAGLEGTRIAVNTLGNLGELAVRSALVDAGLASDAAQLVEIGFPEMTAALERGDVDVIWASEPVATLARETVGAVLVVDSYVGAMEGFPVAGYQASAAFAEANPRTVAAFRRALEAAVERIVAEPGLVAEIAPGFTNLTPELAGQVALPEFRARLDPAELMRVHDYLLDFGLLAAPLDVPALLAPGD